MANGQVLNVPTGWDTVGDPNNPAFRSPTIIVPNAPNNIGSSIGINVAANTGITGVYYRDLSGDKLIGTLSTDGKTFNLTKDGRSYLHDPLLIEKLLSKYGKIILYNFYLNYFTIILKL